MSGTGDYQFLGWQGFGLEHPAEWELNRVRGNRSASYMAFDDGEQVRLEINWKPVKAKLDIGDIVETQIETLKRAAKRRRLEIDVRRR